MTAPDSKPIVKVHFVDFWDDFKLQSFFLLPVLEKRYRIQLDRSRPDFLFYSCFGYAHLDYDCVKIQYLAENLSPDFNRTDYAIGFDYLDFEDRHFRYPYYRETMRPEDLRPRDRDFFAAEAAAKTGFCNFIFSNAGFAHPARDHFFELLSRYKRVDSGGRHLNNIGHPVKDKRQWQRAYKFSIAFENSVKSGYTTEKLFDALASHTIPIYLGNPRVCEEFNPKRFINCAEHESMEQVVERVKEVDSDPEQYLDMLSRPWFVGPPPPLPRDDPALEAFIAHIIDQGPEKARRIPAYGFTRSYSKTWVPYQRSALSKMVRNFKMRMRQWRKGKKT